MAELDPTLSDAFVPSEFEPPAGLDEPGFRLQPLGPERNESDYAAWTSSFEHIHRARLAVRSGRVCASINGLIAAA
jgi:hypothetical protein